MGSIEIKMEKTPIGLHLQEKEEHPPTKLKNQELKYLNISYLHSYHNNKVKK